MSFGLIIIILSTMNSTTVSSEDTAKKKQWSPRKILWKDIGPEYNNYVMENVLRILCYSAAEKVTIAQSLVKFHGLHDLLKKSQYYL